MRSASTSTFGFPGLATPCPTLPRLALLCVGHDLSHERTIIGRDISGDALFASQIRQYRDKPWVNQMLIP